MATPHGEHEAGQRSHIGDEGDEAGGDADQQTEIEPRHGQGHGIEGAEQQAHQRLPPDEAGHRKVHLAAETPHDGALVQRNPAIDRLHHRRPVAQHVEHNHRRHDHQREHGEQRLPARPDGGDEAQQIAHALRHEIGQGPLDVRQPVAEEMGDPFPVLVGHSPCRRVT